MEYLDELLPGLEQYLRLGLAKETLSVANERKRKFFIERLEVLKYPPSLPPRPEGLPKIDSFSSQPNLSTKSKNEEFSAKANHKKKGEKNKTNNHQTHLEVQEEVEGTYDPVDINSIERHVEQDDVYEGEFDPVYEDPGNGEDKAEWGEDSGTDYENDLEDAPSTYVNVESPCSKPEASFPSDSDDGASNDAIYENTEILSPGSSLDDPYSPKQLRSSESLAMNSIMNASLTGELSVKQRFGNSKRVCFVSENRLICFKKDQEKKPVLLLDLIGYDVMAMDADPYSIRISRPGCATHIFRADNTEVAGNWVKCLSEACQEQSPLSTPIIESISTAPALPMSPPPSRVNLTSGVQSEESSGTSVDGIVGEVQVAAEKKKKKGLGLTNLLGTFGLKKGRNLKAAASNLVTDKNAAIGGYISISGDLPATKKWVVRWCVVKEGRMDCYVDPGDEKVEFSLNLEGIVVELATKETHKDLAFKLVRNKATKVLMEASDAMEHGKWMKALIEQTNMASQPMDADEGDYDIIYDRVCEDELSSSSVPDRGDASSEVECINMPPPLPKSGPPLDLNQNEEQYVLPDGQNGVDDDEYDDLAIADEEEEEEEEEKPSEVVPGRETAEEEKSEENVVKCRSGATISEDKGLLETTQNPILRELRKGRREASSRHDIEDKTENLRQKCRELRKKRLATRKKIIYEEDVTEKRKLEAEVASLETEIEEVQLEITQQEVLLLERETSDVKSRRSLGGSAPTSPLVVNSSNSSPKSNRRSPKSAVSTPSWKATDQKTSVNQEKARSEAISASKYTRQSVGRVADTKSLRTRQAIANLENKAAPKREVGTSGFVAVKSPGGTSYEHKTESKSLKSGGKGETKKLLVQEKLKLFESMTESSA